MKGQRRLIKYQQRVSIWKHGLAGVGQSNQKRSERRKEIKRSISLQKRRGGRRTISMEEDESTDRHAEVRCHV